MDGDRSIGKRGLQEGSHEAVERVQLKRDAFADRNRGNDRFVRLLSNQETRLHRDSCQNCQEKSGWVGRGERRGKCAPIKSDQSNTSSNLFGQIVPPRGAASGGSDDFSI